MSDIDRFMRHVDRPGDCWEWTGRKFWDGYGIFYVERKSVRAHRFSYEHFVGAIPEGLVIDHLCRNRACVNPEHLEPVTNRENLVRGRAEITSCPQGHEYDSFDSRGHRCCSVCESARRKSARYRAGDAERARRYRARKREASNG